MVTPLSSTCIIDGDRPLVTLISRTATVSPETPLADVAILLQSHNYRVVPVVNGDGWLIGQITEVDFLLYLASFSSAERSEKMMHPAAEIMLPAPDALPSRCTVRAALERLQAANGQPLPVMDDNGGFLGIIGPTDFLPSPSLPTPPTPGRMTRRPMLGGLATPGGVYLTNGSITGGVGIDALIATGIGFCALHLASYFLTVPVLPLAASLPTIMRSPAELLIPFTIQVALLLLVVRLSPMAGYHAAEHQVVHAIERGESLTLDVIRRMPRVHPRCGTNLVAGALIAAFIGILLQPFIGSIGYLIGGAVALALWRDLGAWMQQHITTRPASDRELRSGLQAARMIVEQYDRHGDLPAPPLTRLWKMGFLPLIAGFLLGCGLVWVLSLWFPVFQEPLRTYLLG